MKVAPVGACCNVEGGALIARFVFLVLSAGCLRLADIMQVNGYVAMMIYVFIIVILLVVIILKYPKFIKTILNDAVNQSKFVPAQFYIYDRSPDNTVCDRLIVIKPFDWVVWAINGKVYILDTGFGYTCSLGKSSIIQVSKQKEMFKAQCASINLQAIMHLYIDRTPYIVPYDIKESSVENKFTILDALNILFKRFITLDIDTDEPEVGVIHNAQDLSVELGKIAALGILPPEIKRNATPLEQAKLANKLKKHFIGTDVNANLIKFTSNSNLRSDRIVSKYSSISPNLTDGMLTFATRLMQK